MRYGEVEKLLRIFELWGPIEHGFSCNVHAMKKRDAASPTHNQGFPFPINAREVRTLCLENKAYQLFELIVHSLG